ncbi:MAG: hypothetical protein AAFN10_06670 [Bacteroidota bacterium]
MKNRSLFLGLSLLLTLPQLAKAQTYFGFQTIGVHTWFVSVSWQGKAHLGVGYNLRNTNSTYTDWQFEWRMPLDDLYSMDNHEVVVGLYKLLRARRTTAGLGLHAKIRTQTIEGRKTTAFGLNTALIPTYIYAAPLPGDAFKGSIGLRLAYQPILLTRVQQGANPPQWLKLTGHRVELGGHIDGHAEGTLMLSNNGYATRTWFFKEEAAGATREQNWEIDGDLYIGTTYYLRRW